MKPIVIKKKPAQVRSISMVLRTTEIDGHEVTMMRVGTQYVVITKDLDGRILDRIEAGTNQLHACTEFDRQFLRMADVALVGGK